MAGSFAGSLPPSVNKDDGGGVKNLEEPSATPELTVAMPVYNAGPYLRQAVLSIINQTFTDWELLLMDDGSSDGSIEEFANLKDPRIRVFRDGRNLGITKRLNQAINLAAGRFFARMDGDDICHPERFALQLQVLRMDPTLDLVGARCLTLSEGGEVVGLLPGPEQHEHICRSPWFGFYLPHPTWMGRSAWFRKHRYAEPPPYCCEDQELLLRSHTESRFYVIPQILLAYRLRDHFNWRKAWRTRLALYVVQKRYFVQRRQLGHLLLTSMVLVVRVFSDALKMACQILPAPAGLRHWLAGGRVSAKAQVPPAWLAADREQSDV